MSPERVVCEGCREFFYADDEEDILQELYYCSFCMPFMFECVGCEEVYRGIKEEYVDGIGACKDCRERHKLRNSRGFASAWEILRFTILKRDGFTCRYCGKSPLDDKEVKLHCDHICPKSKGGENEKENLITACSICNQGKVDVLLEEDLIKKLLERKLYD